jgi:7-cyano-7-deazaguanine tRNA-ribosyltransferase
MVPLTNPLVVGHSLHNNLHRLDGRAGEFPSMFCVNDMLVKPHILRRVYQDGIKAVYPEHSLTILDSGGYQKLKTGRFLFTIGELIDLYHHAAPTLAISRDHPIESTRDLTIARRIADANLQAYRTMLGEMGSGKLVPVVHGHTASLVRYQCTRLARLPQPPMVCIGGNVPVFKALTRNSRFGRDHAVQLALARAFVSKVTTVLNAFEATPVHVLGAGGFLSIALSLLAGASSVDSAGWRLRAAYGAIIVRGAREIRLREVRGGSRGLARLLGSDLSNCACPSCSGESTVARRAKMIQVSFRIRAMHNLWTLSEEIAQVRGWVDQCRVGNHTLPHQWNSHPRADFLAKLAREVFPECHAVGPESDKRLPSPFPGIPNLAPHEPQLRSSNDLGKRPDGKVESMLRAPRDQENIRLLDGEVAGADQADDNVARAQHCKSSTLRRC